VLLSADTDAARRIVDRIVKEEAVVYLDDLLLRRTDWGFHPEAPADVAARVLDLRPEIRAPEVVSGIPGRRTDG
jgi:glycerol-3-phosphate dehydrogenase